MKSTRHLSQIIIVALAVVFAACGDDGTSTPDSGGFPVEDSALPDADDNPDTGGGGIDARVGDIDASVECGGDDCSGLSDMCNVGSCNTGTDMCVALPVADGTACDDDDVCTIDDACIAGLCDSDIACPTGVSLGALAMTDVEGDPSSGAGASDDCPPGEVVIGVTGRESGGGIDQIRALCGLPSIAGSGAGPYTVEITPTGMTPLRGTSTSGIPFTRMCPDGEAIGSFGGFSDLTRIRRIALLCARMTIIGAPGSFSATRSRFTGLPQVGPATGSGFLPLPCYWTTGLQLSHGSVITAMGLRCRPPSLSF